MRILLLRKVFCSLSLLGVVLVYPGGASPVRADDGIPQSVEVASTGEHPAIEDGPAVPERPVPEPAAAEEGAPTEDVLAAAEGTAAIALQEDGELLPLATVVAAEILESGDPMWCPAGVPPVAHLNGCTDSYTSFMDLLQYLDANEPSHAGIIWIEKGYDSGVSDVAVTSFTLDGAVNFPIMKDYPLTLRGGWNGDSAGTSTQGDPSEFNANLNILNWRAPVTLMDLLITGAAGPGMTLSVWGLVPSPDGAGLAVSTTGAVKLKHVDAVSNTGIGVIIVDNAGSAAVTVIDGVFSNNGAQTGGAGIYVASKGPLILEDVTANGNSWGGALLFNDIVAGAQGDVTLAGTNAFNRNGQEGLMISSNGNIALNNISANGNGLTGAYIYNAGSMGNITFTGSSRFNNNSGSGMYVYSDGVITVHNVTATGNGDDGVLLLNGFDAPSQNIRFTGTNVFRGNASYGLYIGMEGNFTTYGNITTVGTFILGPVSAAGLPGSLPGGTMFISGLQVLSPGEPTVISFRIPAGVQDAELSILYWDETQWLDLSEAVFGDGRTVVHSGHKTENGYFQATVNFGGTFVLVQQVV